MKKTYNPKNFEQDICKFWEEEKVSTRYLSENPQESFCIMSPPPNITGKLHMGHALQQAIMDVLIRYERMKGKNILWQTGTDHAGIATEILIEKKISLQKSLTQKNFIEQAWEQKKYSEQIIKQQVYRLGSSINWDKEFFTMDESFYCAVQEVFQILYHDGMIYRSKKLVNWDTKLCTAISDLEVKNKPQDCKMYYVQYPIVQEPGNNIVVATTRPETLIGDVAIAVNKEDKKYTAYVGKKVIIPLINKEIPIISDSRVDSKIGTGFVKITPAHDFNDYEIGKSHFLPMINILTKDGKIREQAEFFGCNFQKNIIPEYLQGLDITESRKRILYHLKAQNFLQKEVSYKTTLPYSERTDSLLQPMLTTQWYIKTKELAKQAIKVVKEKKISFFPEKYENMYFSWMQNIKDWCISRQIKWGHRIPAWYDQNGKVYVGRNEKEIRSYYKLPDQYILRQDKDVLDTWFSSSLWTFVTLGWPKKTKELETFHPTSVLVSGYDIIFFWIARMIMLTIYLVKDSKTGVAEIPFKKVLITGLITDKFGQKMSKSKNNDVDPLDIVDGISLIGLIQKNVPENQAVLEKKALVIEIKKKFPKGILPYGADALRFSLISQSYTNRSIKWNMERVVGCYKFCNKIWNAGYYVMVCTQGAKKNFYPETSFFVNLWILGRFKNLLEKYQIYMQQNKLDIVAKILYSFLWDEFCDWYLEISKVLLQTERKSLEKETLDTLSYVFQCFLKIAHPFLPFVTEKIWQYLQSKNNLKKPIALETFPKISAKKSIIFNTKMQWLKKIITYVRNKEKLSKYKSKSILILCTKTNSSFEKFIFQNYNFILHCLKIRSIQITNDCELDKKDFKILSLQR